MHHWPGNQFYTETSQLCRWIKEKERPNHCLLCVGVENGILGFDNVHLTRIAVEVYAKVNVLWKFKLLEKCKRSSPLCMKEKIICCSQSLDIFKEFISKNKISFLRNECLILSGELKLYIIPLKVLGELHAEMHPSTIH